MNIGEPERIIQVEPVAEPLPGVLLVPAMKAAPDPAPGPRETVGSAMLA